MCCHNDITLAHILLWQSKSACDSICIPSAFEDKTITDLSEVTQHLTVSSLTPALQLEKDRPEELICPVGRTTSIKITYQDAKHPSR